MSELFSIPEGGFQKLATNRFVEETIESLSHTACIRIACELCNASEATKFCKECAQNVCDACTTIHGRQRAMLSHTVVSLYEKESS